MISIHGGAKTSENTRDARRLRTTRLHHSADPRRRKACNALSFTFQRSRTFYRSSRISSRF